jgi:hypothetical protein
LEVHEKLESTQQKLLTKVEVVQNYYQVVDQSLNNIHLKEREAIAARVTFQEVILLEEKDELARATRLSLSEKTRGDIILKTWEANLVESKRLASEMKKACEEPCSSLDKESMDIGRDSIFEALGQIDITKNQFNSKTSVEEAQAAIL